MVEWHHQQGCRRGILDAYDEQGRPLRRVDRAPLAAPFAMLMPCPSFGPLGGKLLVANYGDGRVCSSI